MTEPRGSFKKLVGSHVTHRGLQVCNPCDGVLHELTKVTPETKSALNKVWTQCRRDNPLTLPYLPLLSKSPMFGRESHSWLIGEQEELAPLIPQAGRC